jgi:hypothetical protein
MSAASLPAGAREPSAIALIEEAVHLLRRASPGTLALYYLGAVPWVLGLLFFWAHTTWLAPTPATVAWAALGLAALFTLLKVAQVEFCARLWAQRLGQPPPRLGLRREWQVAEQQLRLQPWGLPVLLLAAVVGLPFGWLYAFYQNAVVLGGISREKNIGLRDEAWAQAMAWPKQNHVGLLCLSLLALAILGNVASAFWVVPWLANRLLGIDNLFGTRGWWMVNTTFLASVVMLAWLAVDPLIKAFYVLRVFHGRARSTGEDLLEEFAVAKTVRRVALAVMVLALSWPATPRLAAETIPPPAAPKRIDPAELNRAIDRVLAQRDFEWRLRPVPVPAQAEEESAGPIAQFFRTGVEIVREIGRSIGQGAGHVIDWLDRVLHLKDQSGRMRTGSTGLSWALLRVMLYLLIAAAVVLIGVVAWMMWKQSRREGSPTVKARAVAAAEPDLNDENVHAAHLPADGWLALARERMAAGEWRLALRALYLATLAGLAADGLISLAKFKTNLDYERELRRRALTRNELVARFAARRRMFEDVWYGHTAPVEPAVRGWLAELEAPSA